LALGVANLLQTECIQNNNQQVLDLSLEMFYWTFTLKFKYYYQELRGKSTALSDPVKGKFAKALTGTSVRG